VPRRQALIGLARANGALIAEDDYDGEFRYDAPPGCLRCSDWTAGTTTRG
jgi:DNA-binding transcriptional MocR family regulator